VVVVTEVEEFHPRELGAVVGDDRVGDAKTIDDVGEERDRLLGADFKNLSTAMRRWVKPSGAFRSGPTMSRFQTAKGHVMGIVCNACTGR
jgi:hypothetical protein